MPGSTGAPFAGRPSLEPNTTLSPRTGFLLPDAVARVAGLPTRALEDLRDSELLEACDRRFDASITHERSTELLIDALYKAIGTSESPRVRRLLVQLKRDLHNRRQVSERRIRDLVPHLPSGLAAQLDRWLTSQQDSSQHDLQLLEQYAEAAERTRRHFHTWVADPDFRSGLLLSSTPLSRSLRGFLEGESVRKISKQRQLERGLLRYFSRMVMKTSPFATFCALVPGTVQADFSGSGPRLHGDPRAKAREVRLNKAICGLLLDKLLRRPAVRRAIPVEIHPALERVGDTWVFLSNVDGRETFQHLPDHPVLDLLRQLLERERYLPLHQLLGRVCTHPAIETDPRAAERFVDRLLDLGFLRFRIGIADQEVEWARPLMAALEGIDDPAAARVIGCLRALGEQRQSFTTAEIDTRGEILAAAKAGLRETFEDLEIETSPDDGFLPFYEDASADAELRLPGEATGELAGLISEVTELTQRLAWPRSEQATMRHFFDQHCFDQHCFDQHCFDQNGFDQNGFDQHRFNQHRFNQHRGESGGSVPLLHFYELFYRKFFKAHLERLQGPPPPPAAGRQADPAVPEEPSEEEEMSPDLANPFALEEIESCRRATNALHTLIASRWGEAPDAEEIVLSHEDLRAVLELAPRASPHPRSVTCFGQWLPPLEGEGQGAEAHRLVWNTSFAGYGKYFSRFLYLLPRDIEHRLRSRNTGLGAGRLAEILGDAGFNANLHPPLLPWEIGDPTGESGGDGGRAGGGSSGGDGSGESSGGENRLSVADLLVEADADDPYALSLRHGPSGDRVQPVDLGFLNPRMRPPLYQLLSRFAPACNFTFPVPPLPDPMPEDSPVVLHRPRVSYRGRLVLSRRAWMVPAAAFPRRGKGESEAELFVRVQHWRRRHGIPPEVFLSLQALPTATPPVAGAPAAGAPTPTARSQRRHLYKPQFIDFANPLLVDLFVRSAANLPSFTATLTERLPGRRHLVSQGDDRYVTELILQIDFPADGTLAPGQRRREETNKGAEDGSPITH